MVEGRGLGEPVGNGGKLGGGEAMRILVAEDDAISRTLLERTLQRAGYEVISVENGAKAIAELVKQEAPRLALLDWVMPEMNGVQTVRQIRRHNDHAYTY